MTIPFSHPSNGANASPLKAQRRDAETATAFWKRTLQRGLTLCCFFVLVVALQSASNAATLTWDPGHTPTTPSGGAGTWDTTTANWSNGTTDVVWPNTTADIAIFPNTGGTVTITGSLNANALTFNVSGYTVTGGTLLTLGGTTPTVTIATGTSTISTPVAGTLTKAGSGRLALTSASNTITGAVSGAAGSLDLSGSLGTNTTNANFKIGTVANTPSILNILPGATLNNRFNLFVGDAGAGTGGGATYQSGGSLTLTQGAGVDNLRIGSNASGYGYYSLSGGTLTSNEVGIGASLNDTIGVMDVSGGTFTNNGYIYIARGNISSSGVLNVTGGSVTGTRIETLGGTAATATGIANLNVGGGAGAASVSTTGSTTLGLNLASGSTNTSARGIANLLTNGTLTTGIVTASQASPTTSLNFNGGTLKATSTNAGTSYLNNANVDTVNVYSGGGIIDNNGTSITISRGLLAPNGSGVTSIPVASGGVGYIGAPLVQITGGGGTGATAYAVVSGGQVTSIVITSPGIGYTSAPTVTLSGGGATTAATPGTSTLTANTSGGMAFTGSGTTTLTGANTYTGSTTINAGTLKVNGSTATGAVTVNAGASLAGTGTVPGAVSLTAGTSTATRGGIDLRDGAAGTLTLSNAAGLTVGDATNPGVLSFDVGNSNATTDNINLGTTASPGSNPFTIGAGGVVIRLNGLNTLAAGTYTLVSYSGVTNNGPVTLDPTSAIGFATATLDVTPTALTVTINSTGSGTPPASAYWTGSVSNLWNNVYNGVSNFSTDVAGTTSVTALPDFTTDVFFTADTANAGNTTTNVLGQAFTIKSLTFRGAGAAATTTANISGTNALTINNGITIENGNAGASISTSGGLVLPANQTWTNNSANGLAVSSPISGAFGITHNGTGVTTLSGTNAYTGTTAIASGTVSIDANLNLGASTAPVTLNGGTLRTTGATTITNTHPITVGTGGTINVAGAAQYFFNTANTLLGSGPLTLTGNGTLATTGTGNLRVAQANTYNGPLTIQSGGIFEYGIASAVASGSNFTLNNQGEVAVNNAVTMSNAVTAAGGTNSVLSFENGTTGTYSGSVTLNANAVIGLRDWYNYATVRSGVISGPITGTGGLTINSGTGSGGTLTLSNAGNTYQGGTTISASKVAANVNNAMATGPVTIGGTASQILLGAVTLNNSSTTINAGGGVVGQGLIHVPAASTTATLNGPITINGAVAAGGHFGTSGTTSVLNITGPITSSVPVTLRVGTVVLSNTSSNYSALTIGADIGRIGATNAIPVGATVDIGGSGAATLDLAGYNQTLAGITKNTNAATVTNSVAATTSTLTTTGTSTFGGVIQNGTGTTALTVNGGVLTLSGVNTYTGTTTLNVGTLTLGTGGNIPDASAMTLGGGTFNLNNFSETVGTFSLTAATTSTIDFGSGATSNTLTYTGAGTDTTGTVTVINYTPGTDHLFFLNGATPVVLTSSQLAQIKFSINSTLVAAAQLSTGEVVPAPTSGVVISEFRLSGPQGSRDEFIELANNTASPVNVSGWNLTAGTVDTALSSLDFSGKTIPAYGHLLVTNNGTGPTDSYSLDTYATGNVTYTGDINTASTLTLSNAGGATVDNVGSFAIAPSNTNTQYSYVRRLESGLPQDTGTDTNDFNLVDINSTSSTVDVSGVGVLTGARLGAPGPQNTLSPIQRNLNIAITPISIPGNGLAGTAVTPEARYVSKNSTIDPKGRLSLRRSIKNNTLTTVTQMRFRIVAITAGTSSTAGVADIRAISSGGVRYYASDGSTILQAAQPLVLEKPSLPNEAPLTATSGNTGKGGGLNSSWTVAIPGGLAPGASVGAEFLFGIVTDGQYRVVVDTELLP
ncbi:hypothetical protein IAD21_05203 [Abditibacteriota bacterium]|nr:hypothetical protein IAD21_05203 [Abditibacteriota bacterium]